MPQITNDWTVGIEFVSKDFFKTHFNLNLLRAHTNTLSPQTPWHTHRTMPLVPVTARSKDDVILWLKKTLPNFCLCRIWPKLITTPDDLDQVCVSLSWYERWSSAVHNRSGERTNYIRCGNQITQLEAFCQEALVRLERLPLWKPKHDAICNAFLPFHECLPWIY